MRFKKKRINLIALIIFSLVLCAIQAGVWARSTIHACSETDKANIESQHPPSEIAGLAGIFLLLTAAGVIASIPQSRNSKTARGLSCLIRRSERCLFLTSDGLWPQVKDPEVADVSNGYRG